MKLIIAIITSLSLSGCFYQTVDQYDINKAIKYCEGTENILELSSHAVGDVFVKCSNKEKKLVRLI